MMKTKMFLTITTGFKQIMDSGDLETLEAFTPSGKILPKEQARLELA
jgi:hypothetical protein